MNHSLLHHITGALLTVIGTAILVVSFAAYSDNSSLDISNYFLDHDESNLPLASAPQPGINRPEAVQYYEGKAAASQLAEKVLGHYWMALVHNDPGYDHSAYLLSGRIDSGSNIHYDIGVSVRAVGLRLSYAF